MNPLTIFKFATELIVSAGVGSIVSQAAKQATPANARLLKKISVGVGSLVLSSMVADIAAKYTSASIDTGLEEINKVKEAIKKSREEKTD